MAADIVRLDSRELSNAGGYPALFGDILFGAPVETSVPLYDDKRKAFACGVWECTAGVVAMRNWPYDEFCVLLSGRVCSPGWPPVIGR